MICRPEWMAQGGRALARVEGKVIFIAGALPGELVKIQVQQSHKDFDEAIVEQIIEPSPNRIQARCPHYGVCGGCDFQHTSETNQRQLKHQVVQDLFKRMAKIELAANWDLHQGPGWAYRSRARWVKSPQGHWGFRQAESHQVVAIQECPVLTQRLQREWSDHTASCQSHELQLWDSGKAIVSWDFRKGETPQSAQCQLLNKEISADASAFFQSNQPMTELLIQRVLQVAKSSQGRAIDLFSGVGLFAAFLKDHFETVQAVERDAHCLKHAQVNLGNQVEFIRASAEEWLTSARGKSADFLVVDPPRTGLPKPLRQTLMQSKPKTMVYVSCDPVTLARDIGEFVRNGWTLQTIEGFDFYPQTHHLEMFAVLKP